MATVKSKTERAEETAATLVAVKQPKAAPVKKAAKAATDSKANATSVVKKASPRRATTNPAPAKATQRRGYAVGESLPVYLL